MKLFCDRGVGKDSAFEYAVTELIRSQPTRQEQMIFAGCVRQALGGEPFAKDYYNNLIPTCD
eukprot:CAMPEP_0117005848 /NCGR_PEP_ID=MMETSP0472-20121206/6294_1 /TAXON_ID=693140 ORGANISM="Tiarina fusus, Strain LIS" /NCGR_SAMPLE_ID=MMETSP0472 /ASSEMBLY_ACC=CAM_ASM_000603 /LENGTH=61 /DNA_ID=CAMNT_0004707159 /DNA_START=111 /DNA_END=296 /DNA_ORIENTATION=+